MPAAERMAQIVEVASSLIAERGFWGLTLRDVAYACNLTEAGLLHHVGNKDNLLIAVLERRDGDDQAALVDALGITTDELWNANPLPVDLPALGTALASHNVTQPEIVRLYSVLNAEALEPTHPAHGFFDTRERRVLEVFRRAAEPLENAERLSHQALALMDGLQLIWLRNRDSIDLVAEWTTAIDALIRASAGP